MARNGSPDDPNNYSDSEPTQYANLGGTSGEAYSEYDQPTYPSGAQFTEPTPWQRKPAVLVGLGMATVLVLGLLIFAIVKFTSGDSHSPASTTTTPSASVSDTTPAPSTTGGATETVTVSPTGTSATPTTTAPTTTSDAAPSTTTTTTTEPPTTSTSTSTTTPSTTVSTSTSTVTETVTTRVRPTLPWLPREGEGGQ